MAGLSNMMSDQETLLESRTQQQAHAETDRLDPTGPTRAPSDPDLGSTAPVLARGELLGRYVLLDKAGAGGMGVVYAAYDPELDRKIALKLLASRGHGDERARLLREAQAMARLNHPNVVSVHDVGQHARGIFVAMEFVEGTTLRAWEAASPRPWREALDLYLRAGRGLVAAHQAGIIHRDFKPDNVMIGADGRPLVMDFGLARSAGTTEKDRPREISGENSDLIELDLTVQGTVMGTPAYMAPEQHLGLEVDPRTDQFSFCVALYAALYGERPFAGQTVSAVLMSMNEGEISPAPSGTKVPGRLRKVLLRGLAWDRKARWPDMATLLGELERAARPPRRLLLGAAALGALGVVGVPSLLAATAPEPCMDAGAPMAQVWDETRAARVREAFTATGMPLAGSLADRVTAALDAYAGEWATARTEACKATHEARTQTTALLDLRMACLDDRLRTLDSMANVLGHADSKLVVASAEAVAGLPSVASCADARRLLDGQEEPSASELPAVEKVRDALARVDVLGLAGRDDDRLKASREALDLAKDLTFLPVRARAQGAYAWSLHAANQTPAAAPEMHTAFRLAIESRNPELIANAAVGLARIEAVTGNRDAGLRWADVAESAIGGRAHLEHMQLRVEAARGTIYQFNDDPRLAERSSRDALAIAERLFGPRSPAAAGALNDVGDAAALYSSETARPVFERSLEVSTAAFGPDHPRTANAVMDLGRVLSDLGRHDESMRHLEHAQTLIMDAYGPESLEAATMSANIGVTLARAGRLDESRSFFEQALATLEILEKRGAGSERLRAQAHSNLSAVYLELDDPGAALEHIDLSLVLLEKRFPSNHPNIASSLGNRAYALSKLGRHDEAIAAHERASAIFQEQTPNTFHEAIAQRDFGEALLEAGRPGRAIEKLERAIAVFEAIEFDVMEVGRARMLLAMALDRVRPQDSRIGDLVKKAREELAADSQTANKYRAELDAWAARRRRG